jgi:hypothetical protein
MPSKNERTNIPTELVYITTDSRQHALTVRTSYARDSRAYLDNRTIYSETCTQPEIAQVRSRLESILCCLSDAGMLTSPINVDGIEYPIKQED